MNQVVDGISYMQNIHAKLIALKDDYTFCKASSVGNLEDVIAGYKKQHKFFCVLDTFDGSWYKSPSSTYMDKLKYTVFILQPCGYDRLDKRRQILNEIKPIFRSIRSKMIHDNVNGTIYGLNVGNNPYYEVPAGFATGMAGLYFMFTIDNPVNLAYEPTEWL